MIKGRKAKFNNKQGCQVFRFARILFLVSSANYETTGLSLMFQVQAFKQKKLLENRSIGSKVMEG